MFDCPYARKRANDPANCSKYGSRGIDDIAGTEKERGADLQTGLCRRAGLVAAVARFTSDSAAGAAKRGSLRAFYGMVS